MGNSIPKGGAGSSVVAPQIGADVPPRQGLTGEPVADGPGPAPSIRRRAADSPPRKAAVPGVSSMLTAGLALFSSFGGAVARRPSTEAGMDHARSTAGASMAPADPGPLTAPAHLDRTPRLHRPAVPYLALTIDQSPLLPPLRFSAVDSAPLQELFAHFAVHEGQEQGDPAAVVLEVHDRQGRLSAQRLRAAMERYTPATVARALAHSAIFGSAWRRGEGGIRRTIESELRSYPQMCDVEDKAEPGPADCQHLGMLTPELARTANIATLLFVTQFSDEFRMKLFGEPQFLQSDHPALDPHPDGHRLAVPFFFGSQPEVLVMVPAAPAAHAEPAQLAAHMVWALLESNDHPRFQQMLEHGFKSDVANALKHWLSDFLARQATGQPTGSPEEQGGSEKFGLHLLNMLAHGSPSFWDLRKSGPSLTQTAYDDGMKLLRQAFLEGRPHAVAQLHDALYGMIGSPDHWWAARGRIDAWPAPRVGLPHEAAASHTTPAASLAAESTAASDAAAVARSKAPVQTGTAPRPRR